MKRFVAAVLFLFPGIAQAEYFDTGNDLWNVCTDNAPGHNYLCIGMSAAYFDMMLATGYRCATPAADRGQARDAVLKYLADNPGMRNMPASELAITSLAAAFNASGRLRPHRRRDPANRRSKAARFCSTRTTKKRKPGFRIGHLPFASHRNDPLRSGRNAATMRKQQQYRTSDDKCTFIGPRRRPQAPVRATGRQRSLDRGGCREHPKEVVNVAQCHSCSCNCPCCRKFRACHRRICPRR
jgi:Rap1a immunity proteins